MRHGRSNHAIHLTAGLASLLVMNGALAGPARLMVGVDRPGVKISPMLYGIFFEEINCAGDGGIYAELVRNRSFEDADQPAQWSLAVTGPARGEMKIDTARPLSAGNPRSLRLYVLEAGKGRVGVANSGYWGIPITRNAQYRFSLYARAGDGFDGRLAVSLEGKDGTKYAEQNLSGVGADWKLMTGVLTASATDPAARLVIGAAHPGTVWLDVVSLFPSRTWKDRVNGLRPDLAGMLDDLRPSFMRFPGGCWVEGDNLATAYRWKLTLGPIEDRRTQWNLWKYHSTNGLGFHEYLQMCEDLRAEPLFVVNCGMSHKENVPLEKMEEWVQDALDAIEYANGSADSSWGALRARNGHPAPFNLKYVEIGNENGGPAYEDRYALFYDRLKTKYPQIHLIANDWGGRPTTRPVEIVDEHYYDAPRFFIRNADRYDSYDRKGPRVYVGEYAVTKECGQGNLRGAVAEAAFMTGMERNSDVVVMASYAPLLANVNYKKWNPDLVNFDATRACGTPSYHVQKMFSDNRADVVLPVEIEAPLLDMRPQAGAIGVGTWATEAEFKEIRVTQGDKVLFDSNSMNGLSGWRTPGKGQWQADGGILRQTGRETGVRAIAGDKSWSDYTYTLKARKLGGAEGFLILFRVNGDDQKSWWNLGGWGNTKHAIQMPDGIVGREVPGRIETGRWYDIRIELKGPAIRCYLDGTLVQEAVDAPTKALCASCGLLNETGEVVLKVVNVAGEAQETEIDLQGARDLDRTAKCVVLTSGDANDENTLEMPVKVAPVTQEIRVDRTRFRHTFPPNSVSALRLRVVKESTVLR